MTTTSTIAEQVADYHRASAGQLPSEVAEAFTAEQRALAAAGEPSGVAQPGTRLPDGELLDVAGQPTTLAQALSGKPAVIVFYRGGWCPYCNIALRTYQAQLCLWFSPDRYTLAQVWGGKTLGIAIKRV